MKKSELRQIIREEIENFKTEQAELVNTQIKNFHIKNYWGDDTTKFEVWDLVEDYNLPQSGYNMNLIFEAYKVKGTDNLSYHNVKGKLYQDGSLISRYILWPYPHRKIEFNEDTKDQLVNIMVEELLKKV